MLGNRLTSAFMFTFFSLFFQMDLFADDNAGIPDDLLEKSLCVWVDAAVYQGSNIPGYQSSVAKLTVPGKSFALNLNANDGRLTINMTPFNTGENYFVLVVQSEMWAEDDDGNLVNTFVSVSSLVLQFGETAVYFPFGNSQGSVRDGLVIEIAITPYTWFEQRGVSPELALSGRIDLADFLDKEILTEF